MAGKPMQALGDDWQPYASPLVAGRPVRLSEPDHVCISVYVSMSLSSFRSIPVVLMFAVESKTAAN